MNSTKTTLAALAIATLVPAAAATSCDLSSVPTNPSDAVNAAAGCPDVSSVQAVLKADWAGVFGIDAATAAKIKGGVAASLEIEGFAKKLDADLKVACGGLAADLGKGGSHASGKDACKAAVSAIGELRGKLGASAKLAVKIDPPRCAASMDAMADCVAQCDANVEPGSVKVECERGKLAGTCDAECKGSCSLDAAAKCEGTCKGSCRAKFKGTCGGRCTGKCDGQKSEGAKCAGECQGKCSAAAEGSCGGKCSGSCEMKAAAKCEGTCRGECSVEMKAPKCEGEITPPKASAECNASCETNVSAKLECSPARVLVDVDGAVDAAAAKKYKVAIQKNLPAVLKIAVGMKDSAIKVSGNIKGVVDGVTAAIKQVKASPAVGARITACVAAPFKAAIDGAASVKASVSVSVDVQASASASASGSASGKAG